MASQFRYLGMNSAWGNLQPASEEELAMGFSSHCSHGFAGATNGFTGFERSPIRVKTRVSKNIKMIDAGF